MKHVSSWLLLKACYTDSRHRLQPAYYHITYMCSVVWDRRVCTIFLLSIMNPKRGWRTGSVYNTARHALQSSVISCFPRSSTSFGLSNIHQNLTVYTCKPDRSDGRPGRLVFCFINKSFDLKLVLQYITITHKTYNLESFNSDWSNGQILTDLKSVLRKLSKFRQFKLPHVGFRV